MEMPRMEYADFIAEKAYCVDPVGFDPPKLPDCLKPFRTYRRHRLGVGIEPDQQIAIPHLRRRIGEDLVRKLPGVLPVVVAIGGRSGEDKGSVQRKGAGAGGSADCRCGGYRLGGRSRGGCTHSEGRVGMFSRQTPH